MCVTCGCSDNADVRVINMDVHNHHAHVLPDGTIIEHSHHHEHHNGTASPQAHLHAKLHGNTISLEADILAKNNLLAAQNRGWLKGRNILALNLMSSPGSGKTTLLTRTINDLKTELSISVIEGDQETINDAKKIQDTGCKVVRY